MAEVNKEPRSTMFLRQRLSVAVQRGNAACILGTLRPVLGGSYLLFIFTLIHFLMRANCVARRPLCHLSK